MAVEVNPKDYDETPQDQQKRWSAELKAARDRLKEWHQQADECVARYLDERENTKSGEKRLNLYTSGIQTRLAMLYGNTPKATVQRRFADAEDDEARVAAELMERCLNSDIEREGDNFETAVALAGWDYEVPGMGLVRFRYVAEFEPVPEQPAITDEETGQELAPAVPAGERKTFEDVETDYVYWKDVLFNAARVWHQRRWVAFRHEMPTEKRDERFKALGPDVLASIPTKSTQAREDGETKPDPLAVTEVWEIWSQRDKKVYWYVEGFNRILDVQGDPLGLSGFFPCPEPMIANLSTTKLVPRPGWVLYQDQYREIDELTTRISMLRDAVQVRGAYDKQSDELKSLLGGPPGNKLFPVDSWAMFAEKGGLRGSFELMPLGDIVAAITALRENRAELIQDLFQVEGMSDIMRGQAAQSGVTATEQGIKARFGSVRMQSKQDRIAKFVSDGARIRAEIIAKQFEAQTIIARSNCERSYDAVLAAKAVELLKSKFADYRIQVKSESMSLTDFAAQRQERMEVLQGVSQYVNVAGAIAQQLPGAASGLLKILQHLVAGLRGADGLESILDQMVQQVEQASAAPQQQAPDPKLQAEQLKLQGIQLKGQQDMEKERFKLQANLVAGQAEVQNDALREENQMAWNVREHAAKTQITNALRPRKEPTHGKT